MQTLLWIAFLGYVAVFLLSGAGSIFTAHWELEWLFGLDASGWPAEARASLLNQYRFLRAVELGFGLFCVRFRREIFADPRFRQVFLASLLIIPLARLVSLGLDGWPRWPFVALMSVEFALFGLFAVGMRRPRV